VLVGPPRDQPNQPSWETTQNEAFTALKAAAGRMAFTGKESAHRRGDFPSVAHGISFGGGQKVGPPLCLLGWYPRESLQEPCHLHHSEAKVAVLEDLMENPSIQRICNFPSGKHPNHCLDSSLQMVRCLQNV
jgi:hypothetical protein